MIFFAEAAVQLALQSVSYDASSALLERCSVAAAVVEPLPCDAFSFLMWTVDQVVSAVEQ